MFNPGEFAKCLTVILMDDSSGKIIDVISDGVEDGILVITHCVTDFLKMAIEIVKK